MCTQQNHPAQDVATAVRLTAAAHPAETSRGLVARERMLRAALDQFGRHGFDGTTTRMIAACAGMNLGAIPYYFGTKEELYLEAAGFLASAIVLRQREPLSQLQALGSAPAPADQTQAGAGADSATLIELAVTFLCKQARILLSEDFPATWVQFFLRVQAEGGPASDRLLTQVLAPMHDALEGLLARICRHESHDTLPRTLTFLAAHQVMSLRLSDALLMRRLGWDRLTPARIDQLIDVVATTLRSQFAALPRSPA